MGSSVIDKYLEKKKKDLMDYANILEKLISLKTNTLWNNQNDFDPFAKGIINYYVEHYYFDNNIHRDNPIEYSNDNINFVLKSLIEHCKENDLTNLLQDNKNETFLLSVIICTACYVDIATNVSDGNYEDTKSKFKYLLQYFQKTNILKVDIQNEKVIAELFALIKENVTKEEKFFRSFINKNSYNKYRQYSSDPEIYLVSYYFNVPGLDGFDSKLVKKINQEYKDEYLHISYELLAVELLKEYLGNGEVRNYFVPISPTSIKNESIFDPFDHEYLKSQVNVLIDYKDRDIYKEDIANWENLGIKFVFEYIGDEEVRANTFIRNMTILVSKEFLRKNKDNIASWNSQGVKFITKNKEEEIK